MTAPFFLPVDFHQEDFAFALETFELATMAMMTMPTALMMTMTKMTLTTTTTRTRGRDCGTTRLRVQDTLRDRDEDEIIVDQRRAVCARGAAGTGKSAALRKAICECLGRGGSVAITSFTAFVADSFRQEFPRATCDTLHGLLRAGAVESAMEMGVRLLPFDLVVVDEVCMLPRWLFDALFAAGHSIDRLPVLLLAGDEGQLAPFTDDGAVEASNAASYYWNWVDTVRLTEPMRANSELWPLLEEIRCVWPLSDVFLTNFLRGRVWHRGELTPACLLDLFQAHPNTTLVCISRSCATKHNGLCQSALLPANDILAERWCEEGAEPQRVPLQRRLPVRLTRNIGKPRGLVNGAGGTVRDLNERSVVLEMQGRLVHVRLFSEKGRRFFPVTRAFADTLAKRQGSTLPHVTVMPDVEWVPAAAYVACSRVRSLDDLMFLVKPRREFFYPAAAMS